MGTMFAIIDFCTVSRETRNSDSTAGGRFSSSFQDLCHCHQAKPSQGQHGGDQQIRFRGVAMRILRHRLRPPVWHGDCRRFRLCNPGFSTIGFTDCIGAEQCIQ